MQSAKNGSAYIYLNKLQPAQFDNHTKPYHEIEFISIYCVALENDLLAHMSKDFLYSVKLYFEESFKCFVQTIK